MMHFDPGQLVTFNQVLDRYLKAIEAEHGQQVADATLGGMLFAARLLADLTIGPVAFAVLLRSEHESPRIAATSKAFAEAFALVEAQIREEQAGGGSDV